MFIRFIRKDYKDEITINMKTITYIRCVYDDKDGSYFISIGDVTTTPPWTFKFKDKESVMNVYNSIFNFQSRYPDCDLLTISEEQGLIE